MTPLPAMCNEAERRRVGVAGVPVMRVGAALGLMVHDTDTAFEASK